MLNKFAIAAVVAFVLALAGVVFHLLNRPIETVTVRGEFSPTEVRQIQQLLTPVVSQGILSVSFSGLREQMDALPWAENLTLRRIWPGTIEVALHRALPIARWGADQYVGVSGKLLSSEQEYVDLPQFTVALDSPGAALEHYRLLTAIFAREQLRIAELNQSKLGEWNVLLRDAQDDQLLVFVGGDGVSARAHRVLKFYRRVLKLQERPVAYVDARYPSGVAVRYLDDQIDGESMLAQSPSNTILRTYSRELTHGN